MAIVRQFVIGVDPVAKLPTLYSWPDVADRNSGGKFFNCAYVPRAKGTAINPMQDTVFLGTVGASKLFQSFRRDLTTDGGTTFRADAITGRLDPMRRQEGAAAEPTNYRFCKIEFPAYSPIEKGATVTWAKDSEDPVKQATTWNDVDLTSDDRIAGLPSGLARWIHVRVEDETASLAPTFSGLKIHYYPLGIRGDVDNG